MYAAKCMTDSVDELGSGGAFDLFVHATQFFGHRVRVVVFGCACFGFRMLQTVVMINRDCLYGFTRRLRR